jgi:hypothetical protein
MNFLRKVIIAPLAYANFYGEALQVSMKGAEDFFSREKIQNSHKCSGFGFCFLCLLL